MAGLLAADIGPDGAHAFRHIAVADLGAMQLQAGIAQEPLQPEIGHHGGDDAAAVQPAGLVPGPGDQRQDLVAVDQFAMLVRHSHAVGIAVQRDAEMRAMLHAPARTGIRAWSSRSPG